MKCHNIVTKNYLLQQYNKHRSYPKTLGFINNRSWGLTQTESGLLKEFVVRVSDDVTSSYSPSTTAFIQIQYSTIEYVILKTPCGFFYAIPKLALMISVCIFMCSLCCPSDGEAIVWRPKYS